MHKCTDVDKAPPGLDDYVDLPVADILLPSRPSPIEPLKTIWEDSEESMVEEEDESKPVNDGMEWVIAELIVPKTIELDDCVVRVWTI